MHADVTSSLAASAVLVALVAGASFAQSEGWKYPPAKTVDQVDDYHGVKVADPYRWLEDPDSAESRQWIDAQNKLTEGYIRGVPERQAIIDRITKLWNFEKYGTPSKQGGRYFWSYNSGLQNQSVIYTADSLGGEGRVLLDPNTLKADGTMALAGMAVSDDGRYAAYGIAEAGSDWNTWKVRDIATGKDTDDVINWVKFSGASFTKDGKGFFYSRFDAPAAGENKLTGSNFHQKVFYHVIGTPQDKDVLVYERADEKDWGFGAGVTEDGRFVVMSVSKGTDPKNRVFYRDLAAMPLGAAAATGDAAIADVERRIKAAVEGGKADDAALSGLRAERANLIAAAGNASRGFVELLNDFDASYDFVTNIGSVFYFRTDLKAPMGRMIAIDTASPERSNWREVIPQSDATIQGVSFVGQHFFVSYLRDARSEVKVFDAKGAFVRDVALPGIGTAGGFGGKSTDTETFYSFSGFTTPARTYRHNVATGESTLFKEAKVAFNPDAYETTQVFYTSKDGTRVPMFIASKKGLKRDGSSPTLLYGYGGFNIPLTPAFSVSNLVWMEMGGVYAVANIRGGGEYGEAWHQAGTKLRKQNVFDDFIAAGEYLVKEKYTSPEKLAIRGGSNGGLLVGACIAQRPDLFGAALPEVGVLDMLRFHKFTIGHAWTSDYGSAENADEFKALFAYSPLHNLKKGTCYPPTMVMTADHDDRVVPAHSFKFAAALQAAQAADCPSPALIRIESRAGHGAGKPTAKVIEEAGDRWSFLIRALDFSPHAFPN
ncbi:MAG: prolyl oligopeptidase family serine peptidase [Phycisphaerales bacterium]